MDLWGVYLVVLVVILGCSLIAVVVGPTADERHLQHSSHPSDERARHPQVGRRRWTSWFKVELFNGDRWHDDWGD